MRKHYKQIGLDMMATGLFHDEDQAIDIFMASLLALRDRLDKKEAFHLGTRLPNYMRPDYFAGWDSIRHRSGSVNKSEFLAEVAFHLNGYEDHSLGDLVPVALNLVLKLINSDDAFQVKHAIPKSMQDIFNDQQAM